jgi:thiol:disulfide interchange protein DsbD
MLKPRFLLLLLALCFSVPAWAQNPVKWTAVVEPTGVRAGEGGRIVLKAQIEAPWYIYAPSTPAGGPTATTIELQPSKGLAPVGKFVQPKAMSHFDEGFQMKTETFSKSVSFGIPIKIKSGVKGAQKASVRVRYQTCNAKLCLPPKTVEVPVTFTVAAGAVRADKVKPDTSVPAQVAQVEKKAEAPTPDPMQEPAAIPGLDNPAVAGTAATAATKAGNPGAKGLLAYAGVAFGAGLLALLTPCVFPMIPITVSFFTKRAEGKAAGISGPIAFCAGIISTFTIVGVAVSVLFGAAKFSQFAANPYVNLGLAIVFILMALNLFGAFEIIVPASVLNRVNPQSKAGLFAPFMMGFAFTLTSFTCTVPFVGTALFTAASGGWIYPAIGMLAFSTAFSLPFFLLALFPAWLTKLPRAGEWLVSTKAFMGFLELAAALKFLSTADMVWQLGYITRPIFLSFWFAISLISAFYLLGLLKLRHDATNLKIGKFRMAFGTVMLAVPLMMLAAMNGSKLGDLDAYLPPESYGKNAPSSASQWLVNDLEKAQKLAQAENKPLLINFTGYACTNCRLMENNVLPHPTVTRELDKFVAVELYTDGTDAKSRAFNQFQQKKFGTIAIPLYAIVQPDGTVRGRLEGLERDPQKFADFLAGQKPLVAAAG